MMGIDGARSYIVDRTELKQQITPGLPHHSLNDTTLQSSNSSLDKSGINR